MTPNTNGGRDGYTIGDIPYSLNLECIPADVFEIIVSGRRAMQRRRWLDTNAKEYPGRLSADCTRHGATLAIAMLLTPFWAMAWMMVLASFFIIGLWTLVLVPVLWIPTALFVFVLATVVYAMRSSEQNPVRQAIEDAAGDIWRWQAIALIFPFYVIPKACMGLLAWFIAPEEQALDEEDEYALLLASDTLWDLAAAVDADTTILNRLAVVLRRELATADLNKSTVPSVDVMEVTTLLTGMRGTTLGQIRFLDTVRMEALPGHFHADLTLLIGANAQRVADAKKILAVDDLRRNAVIELAQAIAGLGTWTMIETRS